ncbi:MAG: Arc family DNA-binding protein [Blastocatellia bacterium]
MTKDAQASLRMPQDLKEEIKKIAEFEHRTLSNTIELLLKNAVTSYWKEKKPLVEISYEISADRPSAVPVKQRRAS